MNGKLTFITLAVTDISDAADFYSQLFDWPKAKKAGAALFFELPNLTLALMPHVEAEAFCGVDFPHSPSATNLFSWNVDSRGHVDDLLHRALELEATVTRAARELTWGGYAGIIRSQDGHLWEIVWNPRIASG